MTPLCPPTTGIGTDTPDAIPEPKTEDDPNVQEDNPDLQEPPLDPAEKPDIRQPPLHMEDDLKH